MSLEKYKGKEVEVYTTLPVSWSSEAEKEDGVTETSTDIGDENIISGEVIEASKDAMTVQYDKRGKTHTWEFFRTQIVAVHTTELNASGKAASERAKARFSKNKDDGSKKKKKKKK